MLPQLDSRVAYPVDLINVAEECLGESGTWPDATSRILADYERSLHALLVELDEYQITRNVSLHTIAEVEDWDQYADIAIRGMIISKRIHELTRETADEVVRLSFEPASSQFSESVQNSVFPFVHRALRVEAIVQSAHESGRLDDNTVRALESIAFDAINRCAALKDQLIGSFEAATDLEILRDRERLKVLKACTGDQSIVVDTTAWDTFRSLWLRREEIDESSAAEAEAVIAATKIHENEMTSEEGTLLRSRQEGDQIRVDAQDRRFTDFELIPRHEFEMIARSLALTAEQTALLEAFATEASASLAEIGTPLNARADGIRNHREAFSRRNPEAPPEKIFNMFAADYARLDMEWSEGRLRAWDQFSADVLALLDGFSAGVAWKRLDQRLRLRRVVTKLASDFVIPAQFIDLEDVVVQSGVVPLVTDPLSVAIEDYRRDIDRACREFESANEVMNLQRWELVQEHEDIASVQDVLNALSLRQELLQKEIVVVRDRHVPLISDALSEADRKRFVEVFCELTMPGLLQASPLETCAADLRASTVISMNARNNLLAVIEPTIAEYRRKINNLVMERMRGRGPVELRRLEEIDAVRELWYDLLALQRDGAQGARRLLSDEEFDSLPSGARMILSW